MQTEKEIGTQIPASGWRTRPKIQSQDWGKRARRVKARGIGSLARSGLARMDKVSLYLKNRNLYKKIKSRQKAITGETQKPASRIAHFYLLIYAGGSRFLVGQSQWDRTCARIVCFLGIPPRWVGVWVSWICIGIWNPKAQQWPCHRDNQLIRTLIKLNAKLCVGSALREKVYIEEIFHFS